MTMLGLVLSVLPVMASGPAYDSSGNANLKGTYYFREVFYLIGSGGAITEAIALNWSLTFDGAGNYSIPAGATYLDSNVGQPQQFSTAITGTYSVSSTGYGYLSNPLSKGDVVYFTLSSGVLN